MWVKRHLTDGLWGTMLHASFCVLLATPCLLAASDDEADTLIGFEAVRILAPGFDGSGYVMVIIDDGFNVDHPDLAGRVLHAERFGGSFLMTPHAQARNRDGGTAIASIAAGAAPGADLVLLKVDTVQQGPETRLLAALQWVLDNARTPANPTGFNFSAVNIAFAKGGYEGMYSNGGNPDVDMALNLLVNRGIIPVATSGYREAIDNGVAYPAASAHSISVAGSFDTNTDFEDKIFWSDNPNPSPDDPHNKGAWTNRFIAVSQRDTVLLDVTAPGAFITGAALNGGFLPETGDFRNDSADTTFATAYVTAAITLAQQYAVASRVPRLGTDELRLFLQQSATITIDDTDGDEIYSNVGNTMGFHPLLNAYWLISDVADFIPDWTPWDLDFDNDGQFFLDGEVIADVDDICVLQEVIRGQRPELPRHDVNLDGNVDLLDMDKLIIDILGTYYGDANLDAQVDAADQNILGQHWLMDGQCWKTGEFTTDVEGMVDAADQNEIGQHWLKGVPLP